ncbi:erythromycin esterase family protein [Paenibacillus sp. GSMTC-2017]|nr:erythromycin esterase family protein [Paenibacillus sp. GSMTC-2017]
MITILEQNKDDLIDKTEEYEWILQSARVIEQFTTTGSGEIDPEFFLKHDIAMYENVKWTQTQFGKTIVWGHNGQPQLYTWTS